MRSAGLVAGSVLLSVVGTSPAGAWSGVAPGAGGSAAATALRSSQPTVSRSGDSQRGRWTVVPVGPRAYRLTWRSPTAIPVTDAAVQVRHGSSLVTATVAPDARSVSVVVASSTPPDPATYDVVLGARVLDRRTVLAPSGSGRTPSPAPATRSLLQDPGRPGTHAISSTDYRLPPVKLPGISQLSEIVGHVVAPVDATDASPLVLFLHGRHQPCYASGGQQPGAARFVVGARVWSCPAGEKPVPSYLGYDYVQRLLAGQGYVTVSISADAINALDFQDEDGGAAARAALVRDHLRAWVGFVASGTHPADLSRVILVGHSRGGEGVDRASLDLPVTEGYSVAGQVLIAPTDFAFQAAPATPTVTLLPYCDGDVSDLQGQTFTDAGRDVTPDPTHDLAFHSSVLVMGADHNFFNTEWTPGLSAAPSFDDWFGPRDGTCGRDTPSRLSAAEQRKVARAYIAGAVHLFADADTSALPMFDGSPVAVPSAGGAEVRSHAIGGGIITVRPGLDGSPEAGATAAQRLCTGVSDSEDASSCQPRISSVRTPHWPSAFFAGVSHRQFLQVGWSAVGQHGGLDLDQPWDLSADTRLDLRTIVDPRVGPVHLAVSLTDADGHSTVLSPVGDGNLYPLPGGSFSLAKRWAQDLQGPLAGSSGIDLTRVTRIELVSRDTSGRVFLVDVSATPAAGVSPAPTAPLPVFSIDTVRRPEGDGTDRVTVDVPWHVTGTLDHDASVTIVRGTPFSFGGPGSTRTLTLPAHTSSGVLHVSYRPNDRDDQGRRFLGRTAYPISGVETGRYVGGALIIDDDPTPAMRVRTVARRVAAGGSPAWRLTLAKPINYDALVVAKPVRAVDGPQLRVGDLTRRFRRDYVGHGVDLATPLYRARVRFYVVIPRGRSSQTLSIPTRAERGVTRAISLQFHAARFGLVDAVRTVRVVSTR